MSTNLSAKYYQENKERPQKKAHKRYQNLSKEEEKEKNDKIVVKVMKKKKKSGSMVVNVDVNVKSLRRWKK